MEQKKEIIQEAQNYTQRLYYGIPEVVSALRSGELKKGYQLLDQVLEGILWLYDVFNLANGMNSNEEPLEMKELCEEMIEAMENKDNTLVADLLEYELKEKTKIWESQLATMI